MKRTRKLSIVEIITSIIGGIFTIIGGAITMAFFTVCSWVFSGFMGYFLGYVMQYFFGVWIVDGLNMILNTTRFTVDAIPYMTTAIIVLITVIQTKLKIEISKKG